MADKKTAKIAGAVYLVVVLTGIFSLAYVPSKLIVWNDAAATISRLQNGDMLFRLGIAGSILCYLFFTLLPLVLYRLLQPVNSTAAKMMVVLAIISVPISFVNLQNKFAVMSLLDREIYLPGQSVEQLQGMLMFYLRQYDNGILLLQVFWGLWLFPFGWLVYRSGFLPKILGVLLMAGCIGYLVNFTGHLLIKGYAESGVSAYVRMPASLGEIGICLWLLVMGVKQKRIGN